MSKVISRFTSDKEKAEKAERLARSIMSEAGGEQFATRQEQIAVGFASQRNTRHVTNKLPTHAVQIIADDIVDGKIVDNTKGANHWYSPMSMPKDGDPTNGFDTTGGLEQTLGLLKKNYKPKWADETKKVKIEGVRDSHLKFYKLP